MRFSLLNCLGLKQKQASKAVVNILKYQKQFGYFFANEVLKLFDSIVSIWGYQYSECMERVQSNLWKRRFCLRRNIPNFTGLSSSSVLDMHGLQNQAGNVVALTTLFKTRVVACTLQNLNEKLVKQFTTETSIHYYM